MTRTLDENCNATASEEYHAPKIRALPKEVVDRIAAGEVVQRPASVVKELIENCLDAESTSIDVLCCSSGGMHLLSISDDGNGICPEDLPLAAVRFATSKLVDFDDLKTISTFGFRGEALASASMVSRLTVSSRCRFPQRRKDRGSGGGDSNFKYSRSCAYKQQFVDGRPTTTRPTPAAGNIGTTVKVEDLFYNVPSRRRAFEGAKREAEEYHKILHVAQRYAVHRAGSGVALVCRRKKKGGGGANATHCDLNTQSLMNVKRARKAKAAAQEPDVPRASTSDDCPGAVTGSNDRERERKEIEVEACREVIGHVFGSAVARELLTLRGGEGDVDAVAVASLRSMKEQQQQSPLQQQQQQNAQPMDSWAFRSSCVRGKSLLDLDSSLSALESSSAAESNIAATKAAPDKFEFAFEVFGMMSNGSYCPPKASAAFILFINDRLVDCATLKRAVEGVYADILPKGGKPFVYLSIRLPGPQVDVNVHPTKREVAVLHEDQLCNELVTLTKSVLGSATASRTFYAQALIPTSMASRGAAPRSNGSNGETLRIGDPTRTKPPESPATNVKSLPGGDDSELEQCLRKKRPAADASTLLPCKKVQNNSSNKKPYDPTRLVRTSTSAPAGALEPYLVLTQSKNSQEYSENQIKESTSASMDTSGSYTFQHKEDCEFAQSRQQKSVLDLNVPGAFAAICRCQIEQGGQQLPSNRVLQPQPKPQGSILRPKKVVATECVYTSIQSLRADVASRSHSELASKLRDATYVGCISPQRSLIQWGIELLMINHHDLARELFYQLALSRFGGPNVAELANGIDVKMVVEQALRLGEGNDITAQNETNSDLAEQATSCLRDKAAMLEEYFGIVFKDVTTTGDEGNGKFLLVGLPVLLDGHSPCPHGLPLFLLRLATEVDWAKESPCFAGICTELGHYYAQIPFDEENEGPRGKENDRDLRSNGLVDSVAAKFVKHSLFPAISFLLAPPTDFADDGTVVKLALLSTLYKVFERC